MKKESESAIQNQSIVWFTNNYGLKHHSPRCQIFSVPNEMAMMLRGVMIQSGIPQKKIDGIVALLSQKMKNMGLKSGASDTVMVIPNETVFVEFKTPEGYQSANQKEFQQAIESCNQKYYVIRSLEQFQTLCRHLIQY